jgi:hypothetical protein
MRILIILILDAIIAGDKIKKNETVGMKRLCGEERYILRVLGVKVREETTWETQV